jgi:NAD(P)-dependent dehydrogenase (short-subunit alcohol dehydrogenase family)
MPNTQDLTGRHAVITGGASGLGLEIARILALAGAAITVVDLASALDAAPLPPVWRTAAIDLAADDSLTRLAELADTLGTVDIVIANAGVVPPWRRVAELDAAEWQRVMAVNSWGVAATLGGFSTALARSRSPAVVIMASINGYKAHPQQVLYTASKHAVIGIMRAAALDLGQHNIRVNALAPGPIATAALEQRISMRHAGGGPDLATALASMDADTALGRIATPEQVANAALWLASDASAGITGIVLPVEAGLG